VERELIAQRAGAHGVGAVIDQHHGPPVSGRTLQRRCDDGNALYCRRTMTLSAAPLASITVSRRKPGPSGATNSVRRSTRAVVGRPLSSTVSGSTPPDIFSASGSGLPSRLVSSTRELFGGNMIRSGGDVLSLA